jgi:hypothetical protein
VSGSFFALDADRARIFDGELASEIRETLASK